MCSLLQMWINVNSFSGPLISLLSILSSRLSPLQLSVSHPPFYFIPLSLSDSVFPCGIQRNVSLLLVCCRVSRRGSGQAQQADRGESYVAVMGFLDFFFCLSDNDTTSAFIWNNRNFKRRLRTRRKKTYFGNGEERKGARQNVSWRSECKKSTKRSCESANKG